MSIEVEVEADTVNHPTHYTAHPSGVECVEITEEMTFCLGNAVKYVFRRDHKGGTEDLSKALWYLNRELQQRTSSAGAIALQTWLDHESDEIARTVVELIWRADLRTGTGALREARDCLAREIARRNDSDLNG